MSVNKVTKEEAEKELQALIDSGEYRLAKNETIATTDKLLASQVNVTHLEYNAGKEWIPVDYGINIA